MRGPEDNTVNMSRRSAILGIGGLAVFGTWRCGFIICRLVRAEDYKVLSDKNRFNFNTIIPERGRILDRFGEALATNKLDFRLVIVPERVNSIDQTLDRIASILPLSVPTRKRIKKDIKSRAEFVPVLVDEHLDWNAFQL